MKKRLVMILAAGLLAVSMTACGGGKTSGTDAPKQDSQETDPGSDGAQEAADTAEEKTITSIEEIEEQYRFVLDGQEYQLMSSRLSDLLNNGWAYNGVDTGLVASVGDEMVEVPEGTQLESFTYLDMDMKKDDAVISIRVINVEDASRPIEECEIASITVTEEDMPLFFQTGAGVSLGDTLSDAKAAYGQYDYGFSENDTTVDYDFYSSYENYVNGGSTLGDIHIDALDEQSLAEDELRFQSDEGSDVINYISMEYYPNV